MHQHDHIALPDIIPVFPLSGALLLPRGHLPLNIFETRYLEMLEFARDHEGVIGMVQPLDPIAGAHLSDNEMHRLYEVFPHHNPLYYTGCVGRLSKIQENSNGTYFIILEGIKRFNIIKEIDNDLPYRSMNVSYENFIQDGTAVFRSHELDRQKLVLTLEKFLSAQNISPRWESFEKAGDEELINTFAMLYPFTNAEKQALYQSTNKFV